MGIFTSSLIVNGPELWKACKKGRINAVQNILSQADDAVLNFRDVTSGYTCLMISCYYGRVWIVDAIINKGANLHLEDFSGNTAMHIAIQRNETNIVARLLAANCNAHIENKDGCSALELARRLKRKKITKKIEQSLMVHKGWLYCNRSEGLLRSWTKRYCQVIKGSLSGDKLELSTFKHPQDDQPRKVIAFDKNQVDVTSIAKVGWRDKCHMFEFQQALAFERLPNASIVSKVLAQKCTNLSPNKLLGCRRFRFAVKDRTNLDRWIQIFGTSQPATRRASTSSIPNSTPVPSAPEYVPDNIGPTYSYKTRANSAMQLGVRNRNTCCTSCGNEFNGAVCTPCGHWVSCYSCASYQRYTTGCMAKSEFKMSSNNHKCFDVSADTVQVPTGGGPNNSNDDNFEVLVAKASSHTANPYKCPAVYSPDKFKSILETQPAEAFRKELVSTRIVRSLNMYNAMSSSAPRNTKVQLPAVQALLTKLHQRNILGSHQSLQKLFTQLDNNSDGSLSKNELSLMAMKLKIKICQSDINWLFNLLDSNHDGRIQFEELHRFVQQYYNELIK